MTHLHNECRTLLTLAPEQQVTQAHALQHQEDFRLSALGATGNLSTRVIVLTSRDLFLHFPCASVPRCPGWRTSAAWLSIAQLLGASTVCWSMFRCCPTDATVFLHSRGEMQQLHSEILAGQTEQVCGASSEGCSVRSLRRRILVCAPRLSVCVRA